MTSTPFNDSATFPSHVPTGRQYTPPAWPVKSFEAQNGSEVRILYGDQPSRATYKLTYSNLPDTDAEDFVVHFREVKGTFQQFSLGAPGSTPGASLDENSVKGGWAGDPMNFDKGPESSSRWRYEGPPQLQSVRRGVTSVTVSLVSAL